MEADGTTHRGGEIRFYLPGGEVIDIRPRLVEDGRISALLDLECSHIGNPAEDLIAFRHSVEAHMPWDTFFEAYVQAGGIAVSNAELAFASIWTPFLYCSYCATAYDTFARKGGFDLATGAPVLVHLPYLLEFLSAALDRAEVASAGRSPCQGRPPVWNTAGVRVSPLWPVSGWWRRHRC